MANVEYHTGLRGVPGFTVSVTAPSGNVFRTVIPAVALVNSAGVDAGTAGNPLVTSGSSAPAALTATTDRSGTATTTSGGLSVAANPARTFLVGQNISAVTIGFNEQGGTAAIGTAGTYTVGAGLGFNVSTNKLVNIIAASGTAAVTMTEG